MKSPFTDTVIANALVSILERLTSLERAVDVLAGQHLTKLGIRPASTPHTEQQRPEPAADHGMEQAILLKKLEKLTLKRHAVLTATLGGQSYEAIAKAMECDLSTAKLHLKAALNTLDVRSRSTLMAQSADLLDFIPEDDYQRRFGLSKRWWLVENAELMAVLRAKKPANNQHTK